jgi:hypothetical protein
MANTHHTDHRPRPREVERHILRTVRKLPEPALLRILAELRSLSTKEARHA